MEETANEPLLYSWRADAPRNSRPKKQEFTSSLKGSTIVIDNGAYRCRVGWAQDMSPALDFRAVLHKLKSKARRQPALCDNVAHPLRWSMRKATLCVMRSPACCLYTRTRGTFSCPSVAQKCTSLRGAVWQRLAAACFFNE